MPTKTEIIQGRLRQLHQAHDITSAALAGLGEDITAFDALSQIVDLIALESRAAHTEFLLQLGGADRREVLEHQLAFLSEACRVGENADRKSPGWISSRLDHIFRERDAIQSELQRINAEPKPEETATATNEST